MIRPSRIEADADELGALLALMPDIDYWTMNDRDLQTLLAFYQPFPGLWGQKQESVRYRFVGMDAQAFAQTRQALCGSARVGAGR